jgi:hypothetical protein
LFELKDDCGSATKRTVAGRYAEPTVFAATPARDKTWDNCRMISAFAAAL